MNRKSLSLKTRKTEKSRQAQSRNTRIQAQLKSQLDKGLSSNKSVFRQLSPSIQSDLDKVFSVEQTSFRELLLTIVYSMQYNSKYRSSKNLYQANPRAVYEQGLRPILQEYLIPCSQSGPLNIAKATKALNQTWAAQRRPRTSAQALLRLVKELEKDETLLDPISAAISYLFLKSAVQVAQTISNSPGITDINKLLSLFNQMIAETADRGNTPQKICSLLLEASLEGSRKSLEGGLDSVFTTNATSNKPGDFCVTENNKVLTVYEVTVKKFDQQRISECSQSLLKFQESSNQEINSVRILCRPEDVPQQFRIDNCGGFLGSTDHGKIKYEYYNITAWISIKLADLSIKQRKECFKSFQNYINQPNTRQSVKSLFNQLV
jgi:hypothetical protein